MSEFKDPAIKLFGKTIPLSLNQDVSCNDEPSTAASVVDPDAGTVGAAGESSSDQKLLLLSSSSSGQEDEEADGDKVRVKMNFFETRIPYFSSKKFYIRNYFDEYNVWSSYCFLILGRLLRVSKSSFNVFFC